VVAVCDIDTVAVLGIPGASAEDAAFDLTRPAATLDLAPAAVAGLGGGARAGLLRALPMLAAELVGVGRGAVELAAAYARDREQFGTPIGRFQGVAHQLADALVAVEEAWSLTLYSAWAVDAGDAGAARAVHVAKAAASEAAVFATERCTQVHGGIGITWEALPHVYLRRAVSGATWLGDAAWHRQRVGADLLAAIR
jgi:alkylation response protein AidB-like acyl-CoA dehydrogenase